jgi:hypothetical protein
MELALESDRRRWEYFLGLPLDDPLSFTDKVRLQCEQNQPALKTMIEANRKKYERNASGFDFSRPDWWNE